MRVVEWLILVFIAHTYVSAFQTNGNIWYQTFTQNNSRANLNILTRGRFGYTVFSLEHKELLPIIGLLTFENTKVRAFQIQGNFSEIYNYKLQETNSTFSLTSSTQGKTFGNAFNDIEYTVSLPIEYLSNSTSLTISRAVIGNYLPEYTQIMKGKLENETAIPVFLFRYMTRIEYGVYWLTIPYVLLMIISFFTALLLCRRQPLKSKGYVPYITCVLLSTNTIRALCGNLPLERLVNLNLCYLETFINIPNNVSIIFLTALNFNKFIVIQFLSLRKERIFDQKDGNIKMKWYIILFKIANKPYFYLIYFFILYIFTCILEIFVLAAFQFKCGTTQGTASLTTSSVLLLFVLLYGVILFILDIIINFPKIKKCEFYRMYQEDSFNIRFEFYFIGVFCAGVFYITNFIISNLNIDNFYDYFTFTIIMAFLYICLIGFPILSTIYRLIKDCFKPETNKGNLKLLLESHEGFEIMLKACKQEYSIENISCWKDIQIYMKEKNTEERKKQCETIIGLYLSGSSSEMEINISNDLRENILSSIKDQKFEVLLFSDLEHQLILNMSDTYSRVLFTPEYISYETSQQLLKDTNIVE